MYGTLFGVWHVWCPTVWAGCSLEGAERHATRGRGPVGPATPEPPRRVRRGRSSPLRVAHGARRGAAQRDNYFKNRPDETRAGRGARRGGPRRRHRARR